MKIEFEQLLVHRDTIIKEAMSRLNETAKKILFVVEDGRRLVGTISDGDIRRWILRDGDLNKEVTNICNTNPVYFYESYSIDEVRTKMKERRIECVPVIDEKHMITGILFWDEIFSEKFVKKINKVEIPAVIMAGGKGTRLEPFTRVLPKPLIPVGEKPIIEIIMDNFHKYGVNDFYLTINYKGEMIKSYFDCANTGYSLNYVRETEPLGTAGSLRLIEGIDTEHFFLSNCDIIVKGDYDKIYQFHKANNNDITIVGSMQNFKIPYGVLEILKGGELEHITEKPEYHFLVSTGMYVLKTEIINEIPENEFFHVTHLIEKLKEKGRKVSVFPIDRDSWLDIGQWEEYHNTVRQMGL